MNLKFREYDELENIFGDDASVCNEVTDYSDSSYLCDAISEVADNSVPVYNKNLCDKCWELNEYVAEAKAQGLLEGAIDLFKMLQMGAYEYYTQLLYNNLDTIALNIAIEFINEEYDSKYIEQVDICDLEAEFEDTDNNDTIDNIKNKAREYMDNIIVDLEEYLEATQEEEEEE